MGLNKVIKAMASAVALAAGMADVAAAAPAAPASESRKFGDWIAVCDNGLRCVAVGPGIEPSTGWIRISMEAGPAARPTVALGFWASERHVGTPPITLHVADRSWPVAQGVVDADYPAGMVADSDARAVVTALAVSETAEIRADGEIAVMSPRGAAAALLWIDEKQGRLGTTTALVRRGDRPASRVPAAPSLPVVRAAPAMPQTESNAPPLPATLERLPDVIACRAETAHNPEMQALWVQNARLDATTELWAVPCFFAAYNTNEIWFLTGPGGADPRRLTLPYPTPSRPGDDPWNGTTNGGFDPESRVLGQFNKGRGLADCGVFTSWVWTRTGFVLQEETTMTECWGLPMSLWPTIWRSR